MEWNANSDHKQYRRQEKKRGKKEKERGGNYADIVKVKGSIEIS